MSRLPSPPVEPTPQEAPGFPLLAVLAPLAGALLIGALTGSPYVLVFAALSPIIAVAGMLDGRRTARRRARDGAARFEKECAVYALLIEEAHRAERAQQDALAPARPTEVLPLEGASVRVGVAPAPSDRAPEGGRGLTAGGRSELPSSPRHALFARASQHPALPVLVPRGTIAVRGDGPAAHALAVRLALEPGVVVETSHEPRALGGASAQRSDAEIEVHSASIMTVRIPGHDPVRARPEFWSAPERERRRCALAAQAARLPDQVAWSSLRDARESSPGIPIGVSESGTWAIDPVAHGPHILIGGTTGSGKSEFLRSLVLGWAHRSSPAELSLLFVDFKGGASFPDLAALPHALEVITDLDESTAARAIASLRAEVQRRERWLRDRGARDVRDSGASLGRLAIVIDEYAALLSALPELHSIIVDLSARGRSLGIHLVLCTQHPSSAVREAIAANCAIRVSFRIAEGADSGMLGSGVADRLRALPPGRALVTDAEGTREIQSALISPDDVAAVSERWSDSPAVARLWQPPLPAELTPQDVVLESPDGAPESAWAFGVADQPERLRRHRAVWLPDRDGALAVVGVPGSGRTGALSAIAEAGRHHGATLVVLPADWVDAEAALLELRDRPPGRALLLADDLDEMLRRSGDERAELLRLWDDAASALRRRGGAVAASFVAGAMQQGLTDGRFPSTLLLGAAGRATGTASMITTSAGLSPSAEHRPPPGRAHWRGQSVQIMTAPPLPSPQPPPLPRISMLGSRPSVVIARRPRWVGERLAREQPDLHLLSAEEAAAGADRAESGGRTVALDDVEGWTTRWSALQELRRSCSVILVELGVSELRSLLGVRERPPSLRSDAAEVWLLQPEEALVRARWNALADDPAGESPL
ncbi:MAG: FtsK/SpoIIIE domain-containing protein [Microcella sp.]|uniref:FtsK/SpoIIIE domain-containing protein n=1 Tax=Microcella sp. TaxID=1913979 RepID=UPI0033154AAE